MTFVRYKKYVLAYEADKERVTQVTDEVLINNGAK